jgi:serine/threonine-protein phosphatase 2A regulatory subunit B
MLRFGCALRLVLQKKGCEYKFHTEFQSHEPEFDYLKSLEIEEKINKIKWCRRQNAAHFLLSTNGKPVHRCRVRDTMLTRVMPLHRQNHQAVESV